MSEGGLVASRDSFRGTQLGLVVIPGPRLLVRMLGHKAKKLRAKRSAGR